jgi:hypothetical protein
MARLTWVGRVVPDQDNRPVELLVGGIQQAGVIGLGEALAAVPAGPAVQVRAVDQPCPPGGAGPGGDQRGYRLATSRSLAPALISSAAASRTRSRRARSCAVSPPPSGYLMVPA